MAKKKKATTTTGSLPAEMNESPKATPELLEDLGEVTELPPTAPSEPQAEPPEVVTVPPVTNHAAELGEGVDLTEALSKEPDPRPEFMQTTLGGPLPEPIAGPTQDQPPPAETNKVERSAIVEARMARDIRKVNDAEARSARRRANRETETIAGETAEELAIAEQGYVLLGKLDLKRGHSGFYLQRLQKCFDAMGLAHKVTTSTVAGTSGSVNYACMWVKPGNKERLIDPSPVVTHFSKLLEERAQA